MNKIIQIGNIVNTGNFNNPQRGRVYSAKGLCPALNTCSGGGLEPKIIDPTVCEERKDEGLRFFKDNVCGALRTKDSCGDKRVIEPKIIQVGNIVHTGNFSNPQRGRVYSVNGISPTLNNCEGCGRDPKIIEPTAAAMRGRQNGQQLEISDREYSNALTTVQKDSLVNCNFRIRKLTPKECWRLMGFTDEDFEKAKAAGISNSQLYKQAGNSIVVNCLEAIFKELLRGTEK